MDEQKPPHTYLGFQKRQRLISLQSIDKNEVLCCRIKAFSMSVFLRKKDDFCSHPFQTGKFWFAVVQFL